MKRFIVVGILVAAIISVVPAQAGVFYDTPYRTIGGETLKVDVYTPTTGSNWPAVIVIHGGGWDDRKDAGGLATELANNGFAAFAIEYRLAPPGGPWHSPAPVEDAVASLAWVRDHGDEYGADVSKVAMLGYSAGAQIALMASTGPNPPQAVVSYSGPHDLPGFAGNTTLEPKIANYIGCSLSACTASWNQASPLKQVNGGEAPTFLAAADQDPKSPVSQNTAMRDALIAAGVPVVLKLVPGTYHAAQLHPYVSVEMYQWLRDTLNGVTPQPSPSPSPTPTPTPSSCA